MAAFDVAVRGCFATPECRSLRSLKTSKWVRASRRSSSSTNVTREQIQAVLEFAARSLDAPPVPAGAAGPCDAHPV